MRRSLLLLLVLLTAPAADAATRPLAGAGVFTTSARSDGLPNLALAAPGDVDRDGRADLVVGDASASGGAGRVRVVFLPAGDRRRRLAGLPSLRVDGARAGDRAGASVTVLGDLDGDGVRDLAIGAPGVDRPEGPDAGAVYLIRGSRTRGTVRLADPGDRLLGVILGATGRPAPNTGDAAGTGVAALGDVDGDGRGDLGIEAPLANESYVITKPAGAIDLALPLGDRGFRIRRPGRLAFGPLARAGDFDGDGLGDMVVGLRDADGAFVVFGRRGPAGDVDLEAPAGAALALPNPGGAGEGFGAVVLGGASVAGGPHPDVVVGASFSPGALHVFAGGTRSEAAAVASVVSTRRGDGLGASMAAVADLDGDRRSDLAIGRTGARRYRGAVSVIPSRRLRGHATLTSLRLPEWTAGRGDFTGSGLVALTRRTLVTQTRAPGGTIDIHRVRIRTPSR